MDFTSLKLKMNKITDVVEFVPTEEQRRAKSNFWSYFASGDALPPIDITEATAARYAGDKRISEWWQLVGFPEWFANKDEFRQRVELLANLALDQLYTLIMAPGTPAAAKVQAIRMIMDVGKKVAQKAPSEEAVVGDKIAAMSKAELEAYIKSKVSTLSINKEEETPTNLS